LFVGRVCQLLLDRLMLKFWLPVKLEPSRHRTPQKLPGQLLPLLPPTIQKSSMETHGGLMEMFFLMKMAIQKLMKMKD